MYRTVFWTLWERARVGQFGRMTLKHVYYHMWNGSPVQVQWMIQDARGWCTGMTQRNGMGREMGVGFRMGDMSTPMVDSCWCVAKPIQYCKVISLQLKYINLYFLKKEPLLEFLVVMYGCESWTIKKSEHWRSDAFELWRRFLRVPWRARRSDQSILKEINPEYSLEGQMLMPLATWCEELTH